jgi:hypothetical protein
VILFYPAGTVASWVNTCNCRYESPLQAVKTSTNSRTFGVAIPSQVRRAGQMARQQKKFVAESNIGKKNRE